MTSRFRADAIVGDIYDTAVAPDGLQRLAAIMAASVDGGSAEVGVRHRDGWGEAGTFNLPDDALQRYASYYRRVEPYGPIVAARRVLGITRNSDLISELKLRQTEFYTDFLRVFDTVWLVGTPRIAIDRDCVAEIGVHRGARSRNFSDRDVNRLQRLAPHVKRALQLRQRFGRDLNVTSGVAALETLAMGCVICDPAGRVLFANSAALALEAAGAGLSLSPRQGIGALEASESRQLAALVGEIAVGGNGGAMILTAADGVRLFALATPLPSHFSGQPGRVLVTLRSEAAAPTFDAATLWRLFKLTPAEARLALAIAAGRSLGQIGREHHVSENTLRTQLASILRKTDTANQRELVRILSLLPPMHRPASPRPVPVPPVG